MGMSRGAVSSIWGLCICCMASLLTMRLPSNSPSFRWSVTHLSMSPAQELMEPAGPSGAPIPLDLSSLGMR